MLFNRVIKGKNFGALPRKLKQMGRRFNCFHKKVDGSLNINEGGICWFCGADVLNVDWMEETTKEDVKYNNRYKKGGRKGKRTY